MHFAARFIGKTYAEFASDNKVLVEANIRCMEYFDCDAVGLISDPYRETSAFGAKISFPEENVPVCNDKIIRCIDDVKALKNPDIYKSERTLDRIRGAEEFRNRLGNDIPIIGWIEGPLAEACDLAGVYEGKQTILDFKQSNTRKKKEWITDYFLQLAAYATAHNQVYGTSINSGTILMCTKDNIFQKFSVSGQEFQLPLSAGIHSGRA